MLVTTVLTASALSGCSGATDEDAARPERTVDVARALGAALDARTRAVRHGRPAAFARLLAGGAAFRAAQETWFTNMTQLPIRRLTYHVDPTTVVRRGSAYWVTVEESLRLRGYDAAPVVRPDRWRFRADPQASGRFLLTSVTNAGWEARHPVPDQPWDLGPVEVREADGVLGIFDAGSVVDAPEVIDSVARGAVAVAATVPYAWDRAVVVYALSTASFLDGLPAVPGHDPGDLDAVAFPVGSGTRFVLNPRMLDRSGADRDRLVRHELTHVALGSRDDHVPVWLAEGLAEWVSVQPIPPSRRRIPLSAVRAAESGSADLPGDGAFNEGESAAHYGLAWWVVEDLARTYGRDEPWRLLEAMAEPGAAPAAVLADRYGADTRDLARQAAALILDRYRGVSADGDPVS